MITLFIKEFTSFFSSLTGYIVIIVFLIVNGLFLWVFPGEFNILDSGYATLEPFFIISPWIFLFLVPAVTMRMIAEEKRTGTIELLLTRPLRDVEIVIAKFFAGVVLVIFSLIPCLIYFITVFLLGNPPGNIDTGGTWGSFIGLFFLATVYVSIGVFASSLSDNQIIAFLVAVLFSFFFFIGFEYISSIELFGDIQELILNLGINEHYSSMSRGVIDSRDIVYFILVDGLFIMFTRIVLQSRKW
ncbi:MAG: gliding motility-associated ABC transporter permease subunit GldF [Bacteroidetes bacterium]|nr:gliding motility-associated ABC transporter permease subunit GldF [Bacteroidota bacterium]